MGSNKKNYFDKECRLIKIFGISLTGDEGFPYKLYSFVLLLPTAFVYPILNFYEYFKHDPSDIADIITYQIGTFIGFCKVVILLLNRVKFGKVLVKLQQEPFTPNIGRGGKLEEKLVNECVKLTTKQTYTFWTFAVVTAMVAVVTTTFKTLTSKDYHDWQMPFGPFTLFNETSITGYEMNWVYQIISATCIATHYITIDMILAAVLVHITYQFKVLQNVVKRLVKSARNKMMKDMNSYHNNGSNNSIPILTNDGSDIPWKYLRKSIEEAVTYHVAIINISKEIEEVFSYLLLMVFLGTLIFICFSTYAASSARNQQALVKHIFEGFAACMQVATICFWGEQVSQESQLVAKAAYEANFVGTDLRFQKMLSLVICRSQVPIKLTAGKFADICFATFAWILRTSYSSFMVLRRRNVSSTNLSST